MDHQGQWIVGTAAGFANTARIIDVNSVTRRYRIHNEGPSRVNVINDNTNIGFPIEPFCTMDVNEGKIHIDIDANGTWARGWFAELT
jgi:hypothetical protein